jgi:hypothetical protein
LHKPTGDLVAARRNYWRNARLTLALL